MFKSMVSGILFGVGVLLSGPSVAALIQFDPLTGNNADEYNGHQEVGFTLTESGEWAEAHLFGNNVPSIFSVASSSSVSVHHTAWSDFTFGGIDVACNNGSDCGYSIQGFLDSVSVLNVSGSVTAMSGPFQFFTVATEFGSTVLDYITITLNLGQGSTSLNLDNINVSAVDVPGPGLGGLLLVGAAGLGFARRRRAHRYQAERLQW